MLSCGSLWHGRARHGTAGPVIPFFDRPVFHREDRLIRRNEKEMRAMKKKITKLPMRFARASGAPISDADAQVIGLELLKIAEANRIGDVRQLTKHVIWAALRDNPAHPLWQFCPKKDVDEAAQAYWLAWAGKLINYVRVIVVQGKAPVFRPMFIYTETSGVQTRTSRRAHVLREDALSHGPEFASAFGFQVRAIINAVDRIAWCIGDRDPPENIARLYAGLRSCIEEYQESLALPTAAE
jgi:hypothetical protein